MTVELPGLRADDPLGFLGAVGLIALSEQGVLPPLRLAWEGGVAPIAAVRGVDGREQLQASLREAFDGLDGEDRVLPDLPADFPIRKEGSGSDPMRAPRERVAEWYARARQHRQMGNPWFERWLIALVGQAASRKKGDVELTPFYAPTGQMSLRVSILEKTMEAVKEVDGPADALVAWRRTSYDGANFDDRAKRDAGVTTWGRPDNQGAPSPTWLAAMGMRLFPMTDGGQRTRTVGWQRVRMYEGFTYRSLIWPVWEPALDPPSVRTILAHPALQLTVDGETPKVPAGHQRTLEALGVTAVYGSSRRTLRQGDGPLGPGRPVWVAAG